MTVKTSKKGFNRLVKNLVETDGKQIKSGILKEDGADIHQEGNNHPITLASICYIQEFGLRYIHTGGTAYVEPKSGSPFFVGIKSGTEINIPERSFIRIPLMENNSHIKTVTKEAIISILSGKHVDRSLSEIGKAMRKTIKLAITGGDFDELSDWAKKRKGSSKPLEGLERFIKYKIEG